MKLSLTEKYPQILRKLGLTPPAIILLLAVCLIPLFVNDQYILRLFITASMTAILAMGFDFTNGYIGICNFGYAAFWGVGAYSSGFWTSRMNPPAR